MCQADPEPTRAQRVGSICGDLPRPHVVHPGHYPGRSVDTRADGRRARCERSRRRRSRELRLPSGGATAGRPTGRRRRLDGRRHQHHYDRPPSTGDCYRHRTRHPAARPRPGQRDSNGTPGTGHPTVIRALAKRRNERGAASLELVVVIPGLVLLLGMMIAGGRLWFARTTVTEAAQTAARAGSLARSASQAVVDGRYAGQQSLSTRGLRCSERSIVVNATGFATPVGTPATVRSRITCRVPLADLLLPGTPGSVLITRDGSAALDTYRARS